MSARSGTQIEIADSDHFLFAEKGILKFTPDCKQLFAVSCDGLINKFDYDASTNSLNNMTECSSLTLQSPDSIGMISVSNTGSVACASESNDLVRLYKMGEDGKFGDFKLVTKTSGSTDALALNPLGTILCCSGKDNNVKVISVKDDNDFQILSQIPTTHFVKSISFSENGNLLALLQVDGILRIFKLSENNSVPQLIKTLTGVRSSDMKAKFQLSWKGNLLGVLFGGEHLRIYDSDAWTIKSEIPVKNCLHFELISMKSALLAFSSGEISIYSIERNEIVGKPVIKENMENCSITIANESFGCLTRQGFESGDGNCLYMTIRVDPKDLIKPEDKKTKLANIAKEHKLSVKDNKKSRFIEDEAEAEEDEEEEEEDEEERESMDEQSDSELDSDREDSNSEAEESDLESVAEKSATLEKGRNSHPVVQPCCTELRNYQRYLAYNNIGFITAREAIEQPNLFNYDIEFMDRSSHQPIRFSRQISFSLAALSEKGVVFAADNVQPCLHYVPFANPEENFWNIPLPIESNPILLGLNSSWIYSVNSRGILNIYALSGLLQSSSVCPGRPISLVCPEDGSFVYLFTEDSEGILCYKLNAKNGGVMGSASRVLLNCSESELIWCGISFSGVLGAFTSKGKFMILLNRETDRWTEILDVRNDKPETVWPVYFDVNSLSGIICKISEKYPDPYPAPHVIDFNFKIPEIGTDLLGYEEVVRTNWILNETSLSSTNSLTDREKKKLYATADRHLLELAQISVKSNRIDRLIDLSRWSSNEKTIDLLIQLARHHKLVSIVSEMESIKMEMFQKRKEVESDNVNSNNNNNLLPKTVPRHSEPTSANVSLTPSGILANLTPLKPTGVNGQLIPNPVPVSSLAELIASPSNPFAKENSQPSEESSNSNGGNAMLDYISAMMNLNNSGKRKGEEVGNNPVKKPSNLRN